MIKLKTKSNKFLRKEKLKKITVVGEEVILPFDEEGIIVEYKTIPWGFPYVVKITKGNFHFEGELNEYKDEDIIFKNGKLNKLMKK